MKKLFLDLETAPNVAYIWSLFDSFVPIDRVISSGYTLCFAAKWAGSDEIIFHSIRDDGFKTMVRKLHKLLEKADVVIHYNGKKFDIPTANKEFLKAGLTPPSPYKQIDIYQTIKRQFRLASNKLDFVTTFFGLPGKTQHKGMELWKGCIAGDPDSWKTMKEYNCNDVIILEKLYDKVLPWIKDHPNELLYKDDGNWSVACCTNCGSDSVQRRGYAYTKTQKYHRYRCNDCGTWSRSRSPVTRTKGAMILLRDPNT